MTLGMSKYAEQEDVEEKSKSDMLKALAVPNAILLLLNLCPIAFFFILRANKNNLESAECRAKYG